MKNKELAFVLENPLIEIGKLESMLTIWLEAESNQEIANMISISLDYTKNVRDSLNNVVGGENHG